MSLYETKKIFDNFKNSFAKIVYYDIIIMTCKVNLKKGR